MEITKKEIKERLYELGADLCGIAGVDRFGEAPEGYHPPVSYTHLFSGSDSECLRDLE